MRTPTSTSAPLTACSSRTARAFTQPVGGGRSAVIFGAILPEAMPSMTASSLFGVEKAIRSAVILGLVGAGGIGVELSTAMSLYRYDLALTIIIVIVAVVVVVETVSSAIRRRIM